MSMELTFSDEDLLREAEIFGSLYGLQSIKMRESSITPKPFITQVPLVEVFERLKRVKADVWQQDFCRRLQEATENRHEAAIKAIVHAQAQLGKSVILAQAFPIWLIGHDPIHRFALMTYNITRSQEHAEVVIQMMQSLEYKDMFKNSDSHLQKKASKTKFWTNARRDLNDAQPSYNPLGLQTGFVGNGADTLCIDDPYRDPEEARSDTVRPKIERKWVDVALPRITQYVNVFGMFHRYFHDDLAGFLLKSGQFTYWRYASQCDGDYTDKETGRVFPDPLNRKKGEYISERFDADYYEDKKVYPQLWASQFQGRPSAEEGNFFDVNQIKIIEGEEAEQKVAECVYWVRAWDNAATEGAGAWTVGTKMGITPEKDIVVADIERKQVNTAKRYELQKNTARADGFEIPIHIPQDPGAGGKDTAFTTEQMLAEEGFNCITKVVTGAKEIRAYNYSQKVNAGKVYFIKGHWNKIALDEHEKFPVSTYKDIIDSSADGETYLDKLLRKGTVITNYNAARNLVLWSDFAKKFGRKIPKTWKIYVAVQFHQDASIPSGAVILARAAESARLGEAVFMVGCQKEYSGNFENIANWVERMLKAVIEPQPGNKTPTVTLMINPEAEHHIPVFRRKMRLNVVKFSGSKTEGIPETNWYLRPDTIHAHPFNRGQYNTRFYWLIAKGQVEKATDELGLLSARQEVQSWTFNDKGEPQLYGGIVLNCVRMLLYHFRTTATPLTVPEQFEKHMTQTYPQLTTENIGKLVNEDSKENAEITRIIARKEWDSAQKRKNTVNNDWQTHLRETETEEGGFEPL